jgi:hypothetical protein
LIKKNQNKKKRKKMSRMFLENKEIQLEIQIHDTWVFFKVVWNKEKNFQTSLEKTHKLFANIPFFLLETFFQKCINEHKYRYIYENKDNCILFVFPWETNSFQEEIIISIPEHGDNFPSTNMIHQIQSMKNSLQKDIQQLENLIKKNLSYIRNDMSIMKKNSGNIPVSILRKGIQEVLFYGARNGNIEIVQYALEEKADINSEENENNYTALEIATKEGYLSIVQYLFEKGANIKNDNDFSLSLAAEKGYFEIVQFLHEKGCSEGIKSNETIGEAARRGHFKVVEYMAKYGAYHNDALEYASQNNKITLEKNLLRNKNLNKN